MRQVMISKESVGVEISSNHLTIAYMKATPFNTKIRAHAVHELDAASRFSEKMDAIGALVKDFLQRHRIGSVCIWVGLPAEMVIQTVISLPSATKENLTKALEYELPKYIPLAPEDIYFGYQTLEEDRNKRQLKILVAAVKKKDLAAIIELRNQLDAGICGVESMATAGINGLKWAARSIPEKDYALAYAANGTLHLGFIENEQIQFMRTFDLKEDLMYQAGRIFQESDYSGTINSESDSTATIKVYCAGPDATEGLLGILNKSPNLECSLLDLDQSPLDEKSPIPGAGLALKSLQHVAVDINLFPEQFRKKPSVIGRYLTLALVVLMLISGMTWAGSHFLHQRIIDQRVDRELNELSDEIDALEQIQSNITALQKRIDYLDSLRQDRIHALEFLKELTEILPDTAWLLGLSVENNHVEVQGYADYSTQLIPQLEASDLFVDARFVSVITKRHDGKEVFKIGFEINRK